MNFYDPRHPRDRQAIRELAKASQPDRAYATVMAPRLLERFKRRYPGIRRSKSTTCLGRFERPSGVCGQCNRGTHAGVSPGDHGELWLYKRRPVMATAHEYDYRLDAQGLADILAKAEHAGLRVRLDPSSWYFPGTSTLVEYTSDYFRALLQGPWALDTVRAGPGRRSWDFKVEG